MTCRRCGSERVRAKYGWRCYACEKRARDGEQGDTEGLRRLSLEPMRPWLIAQVERHGGVSFAAEALGVRERPMYDWVSGAAKAIQLDSADRMLCAAGDPALLGEFWPELYRFDDEQVAA